MRKLSLPFIGLCATALLWSAPASAQFFYQPPDLKGARMAGDEPGIGVPLPDATPNEVRAALVWNLRSGLNVAALQCQFEPTLLTLSTYNAVISDHQLELKNSFDALSNYFIRKHGKKLGQTMLDDYGTKTYSGYSTVSAQLTFCATSGSIMRDALFAPRGDFNQVAQKRIRELRNSLIAYGEQRFRPYLPPTLARVPNLNPECYDKKGRWRDRCGAAFVVLTAAR